jgi:hypothetical protein
MIAAEIAAALGGRREGRGWRCQCVVHGGYSLVVRDGRNGRLLAKCWAGCDARDVLAALRRLGLLGGHADNDYGRPDPAETARRREAEARERERRIGLARDMIAASLPAEGTPVERYLRARLPGIEAIPSAIRYLAMGDAYARHRSGSRRPVMAAAVEHVEHGIVGAHRTWLTVDGSGKSSLDPERIATGPIGGGAVRLAAAAETLMAAEGIETALAAMTATAMPAWAALSTSGLAALILPAVVQHVIILADNDTNGAGERAARAAAARWLAEGRLVRIALPPEPGTDFNDVLLGRAHTRVMEARDVAA